MDLLLGRGGGAGDDVREEDVETDVELSSKKCFAKSVLTLFAIVPVSEITWKTVYVTIQSHVTPVASGSLVQCLITYAIYPIVVIVQNLSNQITSVLLK